MMIAGIAILVVVFIGFIYLTRPRKKNESTSKDVPDAAMPPEVSYIPPGQEYSAGTYKIVDPQPSTSSSDDFLDTMVKVEVADSVIDAVTDNNDNSASTDTPSFDSPSPDPGSSDFGGFDGGSSDGGGASGSW